MLLALMLPESEAGGESAAGSDSTEKATVTEGRQSEEEPHPPSRSTSSASSMHLKPPMHPSTSSDAPFCEMRHAYAAWVLGEHGSPVKELPLGFDHTNNRECRLDKEQSVGEEQGRYKLSSSQMPPGSSEQAKN
jgi:hypothetical protein